MAHVIELYEDRMSGWRVLTDQEGTIGYRFNIVERAMYSSFVADAKQLANGQVPPGLERVDLSPEALHGMDLRPPCALWRSGRVARTSETPGVLTAAYIAGKTLNGTAVGGGG